MTALTLPSVHESVSAAVLAAEGAARAAGVGEETLMRISLAVSEAVANAIEHGNEAVPTRAVQVRIEADADRVRIEVEDEGIGMDGRALESAALPEDPLDVGGRGLYLIRELADAATVADGAPGARLMMEFWDRSASL